MAPRLKESELKRLTHIKVYLRHKRKRAMRLKKDLSFASLRFTPFLGLHSLHGAQRGNCKTFAIQKPTESAKI